MWKNTGGKAVKHCAHIQYKGNVHNKLFARKAQNSTSYTVTFHRWLTP